MCTSVMQYLAGITTIMTISWGENMRITNLLRDEWKGSIVLFKKKGKIAAMLYDVNTQFRTCFSRQNERIIILLFCVSADKMNAI